MDLFSILTIATATLQFAEFGIKVLKETKSIHKNGHALTTAEFERKENDCVAFNKRFKESIMANSSQGSEAVRHYEQAILKQEVRCREISDKLAQALTALKPKSAKTVWTSFGAAPKTVWKADEIKEIVSQLERCQQQIYQSLLAAMADKLDLKTEQILEILTINQKELAGVVRDESAGLRQDIGEIMAVILTLKDGNTRVIEATATGSTQPQPDSITNLTFDPPDPGSSEPQDQPQGNMFRKGFHNYAGQVLDCLHFRYMIDRYDRISERHERTMRWVFKDTSEGDKPWSSLTGWLVSDEPIYWVNGKAASGKSTLMKYIYQAQDTHGLLRQWAGSSPGALVSSAFFFWHLGSAMQKTQEGLLRSLLYNVLKERPELILSVMPELCREAMKTEGKPLETPRLDELLRWFKELVRHAGTQLRFFFLVDGLDEFDGSQDALVDLVELIKNTSSPFVKFLVSSRPVTVCSQAFSTCPSLRLQDLTAGDIREYVEAYLEPELAGRDSKYRRLVDLLVEQASGVFLWVYLVVRSVLDGLRDGDNFEELVKRTEGRPGNLDDLFSRMLRQVPEAYRPSSRRLIQAVLKSLEVEPRIRTHPIFALQLSFVEETWEHVCEMPLDMIPDDSIQHRCKEIEARIKSRCCGLLEFWGDVNFDVPYQLKMPTVQFVHKTAVEYLEQHGLTKLSDGDKEKQRPFVDLFKSCLALVKIFPFEEVREDSKDVSMIPFKSIDSAACCAMLAQDVEAPITLEEWHEFDRIVSRWWSEKVRTSTTSWDGRQVEFAPPPKSWALPHFVHNSHPPQFFKDTSVTVSRVFGGGQTPCIELALLAFQWDLTSYLEDELQSLSKSDRKRCATQLLQILLPMVVDGSIVKTSHVCFVALLNLGADPMAPNLGSRRPGISIYGEVLSEVFRRNSNGLNGPSWMEALAVACIEHGGAPVVLSFRKGTTLQQMLDAPEHQGVAHELRRLVSERSGSLAAGERGQRAKEGMSAFRIALRSVNCFYYRKTIA